MIRLFINIVVLMGGVNVYLGVGNVRLLGVCMVGVVVFTVICLLLVRGNKEKRDVGII